MAGWPAGGLVGNCDFNENPVVHLDFDFDLGFVNTIFQSYGQDEVIISKLIMKSKILF